MLGCGAHVRIIALPHVRCACESACGKVLEVCVRYRCDRVDRTFYPGWYGGRRIPYYGILPRLIWGQTNTVIRNFTQVYMGADNYSITEYVNKHKFNYTYLLKKWSDPITINQDENLFISIWKSASAGAVRSSKNEVRCASACETIIKVRVCVRHTVKFIATQHPKQGG